MIFFKYLFKIKKEDVGFLESLNWEFCLVPTGMRCLKKNPFEVVIKKQIRHLGKLLFKNNIMIFGSCMFATLFSTRSKFLSTAKLTSE